MKSSCTRLKVWRSSSRSHSDPLAGLRAPSLRTAVLLLVLLCFPQQVASDSDEVILTDWELWKSMNGISYEDLVRHIRSETHVPQLTLTDGDVFACVVQEDMQRKIIWEGNKQQIEDNNQGFLLGSKHFTMAMNKYGDLVRTEV